MWTGFTGTVTDTIDNIDYRNNDEDCITLIPLDYIETVADSY